MRNNGNHVERRVALLERAYRDDRKRWDASHRLMQHTLQRLQKYDERHLKYDERHLRFEGEIAALRRDFNRMGERQDEMLRVIRRLLER